MSDQPAAEQPVEVRLDVAVDAETGEHTNNGTHAVHVVCAGGMVVKLAPGESLIPPSADQHAVVTRLRAAG